MKKKKTAEQGTGNPEPGKKKTAEPGTGNLKPGKEEADMDAGESTVTIESGGESVTVSEATFKNATGRFLGLAQSAIRNLQSAILSTPNILAPPVPPTETGTETIGPACVELRQMAQRLIDTIREHRHLQDARLLLLVVEKPAVAKALEEGKRKSIGKAAKARSLDRLLSSVRIVDETDGDGAEQAHHERADFIIRLCGDWLEAIGWPLKPESGKRALAIIDHELCHCGAKIAGEFVKPAELAAFVEGLGDDHIETCQDVVRDKAILVRYYWRGENGGYAWVVRKHDVEEFHGVIERHGAWDSQLMRLVDVLVAREDLPLLRATALRQAQDPAGKAGKTLIGGEKLDEQLSGLGQAN